MPNDSDRINPAAHTASTTDSQVQIHVMSEDLQSAEKDSSKAEVFGVQSVVSAKKPRALLVVKVILQCLLVFQIVLGVLTIYTLYSTRNARDFSGLAAFATIVLHVILFSVSVVLFGYYVQACKKSSIKRGLTTTALLVASFFLIVLSSMSSSFITADPPYGGYEKALCADEACMSQHFSRCALVDYTAKSILNAGTPDEAIATTRYSIYSTTEYHGCHILMETHIETPLVTLADGTDSKRTLKHQTVFCQAYPGMDFKQYIQEVLDDPRQHSCTGQV